jgi:two-component system KDP operon response regulator KdpE
MTAAQPSRSPAGAGRILVVDDQPELVRALAINLRARQYEVLTARTGCGPRSAGTSPI